MKSVMLLKVISLLPRNWKSDCRVRYSPPNFSVCAPLDQVRLLLNDSERGSKMEPMVDDALVARISRPLRAIPVVPRASIDCEVTVPDSETPVGSYPCVPKAIALVSGRLSPT